MAQATLALRLVCYVAKKRGIVSTTATPTSTAPRLVTRTPRSARRARDRRGPGLTGLLFLAPFLVVYAVFLVFPVVQAFYMSGFKWDLLSPLHEFVGVANYKRMLWGTDMTWSLGYGWPLRVLILGASLWGTIRLRKRPGQRTTAISVGTAGLTLALLLGFHPGPAGELNDPGFWIALRNTLVFTAISTPILIGLGLAMALALNNRRRGRGAYRAVFFLPYVLPISAVTLIWSYLLNPDRGLIAGTLHLFGLDGIAFLSDPNLAMPSIIATTVWWSVGFNLVLFLAGLQDIEPALYEAAALDGAGAWQRFRHITVPGLTHVTVLVTITQIVASFQIFGQVFIMTKGGPGTATEVLIQHIYEAGFKNYELGYAAAVSVFLFIVMVAVSFLQFRLVREDA